LQKAGVRMAKNLGEIGKEVAQALRK
jgi:hypothetical protein